MILQRTLKPHLSGLRIAHSVDPKGIVKPFTGELPKMHTVGTAVCFLSNEIGFVRCTAETINEK